MERHQRRDGKRRGRGREDCRTPTRAGELAARAEPKKLLLTHLYPACEGEDLTAACQKVYPGEILLARDLMTICL